MNFDVDVLGPGRLLLSLKVAHRVRAVARFRAVGATSPDTAVRIDRARDNPLTLRGMLDDGVLRAEGDRLWLDEDRLGDEDALSYAWRLLRADWRAGAVEAAALAALTFLVF